MAGWVRLALTLAFVAGSGAAAAQPLALPPTPDVHLEQRIGAHVPLDVPITDDTGRPGRLADFVDGTRPVLLVPGYYRCPRLCGLVMHGLLDALQASGVPRRDWRIVGIGIDPRETPADARVRRAVDAAYAQALAGTQATTGTLDLRLLVLQPPELARVTAAVGDRFAPADGADGDAIAHPATVVLLTPGGTVSRYFNGVAMDAGELRVALADAAGDRLGSATARLALLCAHFDPRMGRLDGPVMNGLRALCLLIATALAAWCGTRRGPRDGEAR